MCYCVVFVARFADTIITYIYYMVELEVNGCNVFCGSQDNTVTCTWESQAYAIHPAVVHLLGTRSLSQTSTLLITLTHSTAIYPLGQQCGPLGPRQIPDTSERKTESYLYTWNVLWQCCATLWCYSRATVYNFVLHISTWSQCTVGFQIGGEPRLLYCWIPW